VFLSLRATIIRLHGAEMPIAFELSNDINVLNDLLIDCNFLDVDECAEGTHNCTGGAGSCVNAVGTFRCVDSEPSSGSGSGPGDGSCDLGYRFDLATLQCKGNN